MTKPLLSVLMPVYNCAEYIEEALASIQAQTFTDFEVLVIDDGCSDETPAIVRRIACHDQRIKIISRENRGIVDSLNEGVALAQGRWLARMDGDDICEPHRFSCQLAFLNAHPEVDIVGSWVQLSGLAARSGITAGKIHLLNSCCCFVHLGSAIALSWVKSSFSEFCI